MRKILLTLAFQRGSLIHELQQPKVTVLAGSQLSTLSQELYHLTYEQMYDKNYLYRQPIEFDQALGPHVPH